jgi:hypothetical protein
VKERPVVKRLKHEPLVDAVDHFASLLAGRVETEILQDDETPGGNEVPLRATTPVAGARLSGEKLGSPSFGCDARAHGCDRIRSFTGEVPHDLPADGRVRIEEPLDVRGPGCVIVAHLSLIARGIFVLARAPDRLAVPMNSVASKVSVRAIRSQSPGEE